MSPPHPAPGPQVPFPRNLWHPCSAPSPPIAAGCTRSRWPPPELRVRPLLSQPLPPSYVLSLCHFTHLVFLSIFHTVLSGLQGWCF